MKNGFLSLVAAVAIVTPAFVFASGVGFNMKNAWEPQASSGELNIYTNKAWDLKNAWEPQASIKEINIYTNSSVGVRMKGGEATASQPNSSVGTRMRGGVNSSTTGNWNINTNGGLGSK